jgi:EpsI family protein
VENSLVNPSRTVEDLTPLRSAADGNAARLGHGPTLLRAVGLGLPLILLCAPTVGDLANMWWNGYGFSHGFLVPLVSLYLAWLQGPALRRIPVAPALGPGLLWLVVATLLLLASEAGGVVTTAGVALILVLAGLVLLLCGWGYLRALAFPLAYLIFMTPVLGSLTEPLEWPFQLLTASMSVVMLQALGIPVLLEHSIDIVLPTVTLEVARQCSGAGLLVAVLAIGLPLASLTLRAWWSRIALVLSSIMVAIMANWIRLTVMGVYAQAGGKDLHGPYHILQGLFVDWVAFAYLFAGVWLLGRLERAAPTPVLPRENGSSSVFIVPGAAWNSAWWLGSLTLAAAAMFLYSLDRGATALKTDLATFPAVLGDWVIDHTLKEDTFVGLPAVDDSLVRTYRAPDGRRVHLYVAYTTTQRQGKELVGMATAPLHEKAVATDLRIGTSSLPANRTFIDKSHRQIPAVFWYHINGMSYADRAQAKLATITQAFLRGRTDGALVLVSAEPRTGQSEEQWKTQEAFAGVLFPLMREYLP